MTRHLRPSFLALALSVTVLALVGATLAVAMPTEPAAPAPGPTRAGSPPDRGTLAEETRASADVLQEPEPLALRAREVNAWVDGELDAWVDADLVDATAQITDPWAVIDQCVLDDMAGEPGSADDNSAASIAIAIDGVITYTKGYKDAAYPGDVDANTLFRIGSTTKMMTAAAIMQLADQDAVLLDAPLPTYLPEYRLGHPWRAEDLNLHLLMSHQSGLIDQYFANDGTTPLLSWVQDTGSYSLPLYAAPGSFWNYANPNFSLAGAVVERVSGMPFNDYMNQKLWDPAGMPLTTLSPTDVISTGNYATGYHDGQPLAPNEYYFEFLGPAGFAFSTPTELVRWALRLQAGDDEVLTADSKQLMQTPHVGMGYLPWMTYGYGVMITDWRDKTDPDRRVVVYDHGGNIYGGSSQLYWIPERGVVVSILSNTIRSLGNAAACAVSVLADVEPLPGDSEKRPPDEWDAFTGTYSLMDVLLTPWTANVTLVSDTLTLDFNDIYGSAVMMGDDMRLYYAYGDVVVADAESLVLPPGIDFTFIRDPEDRSQVTYMRNRSLVGQRVGQFPDRVTVVGKGCAPVRMKAELDMPVLGIRTSGLVTSTHDISVPLAADDPNDPLTTRIKRDFTVGESGADMLYARADTEPDDAAVLFVRADLDGVGEFSFVCEGIANGVNEYGASVLYVADPLPAGDYQLWVWGYDVKGNLSVVNLDLTVMQGDDLRLDNRPRGLADGAEWEMRVCADDVAGREPLTGMIQFTYDSPPRLFRVMVDWLPAVIYLPLDLRAYTTP